jgi:hypothetical protein
MSGSAVVQQRRQRGSVFLLVEKKGGILFGRREAWALVYTPHAPRWVAYVKESETRCFCAACVSSRMYPLPPLTPPRSAARRSRRRSTGKGWWSFWPSATKKTPSKCSGERMRFEPPLPWRPSSGRPKGCDLCFLPLYPDASAETRSLTSALVKHSELPPRNVAAGHPSSPSHRA